MPTTRLKSLQPPVGGLDRRHAFQWQAPFTTPLAQNVWPTDQASGRGRIGSRPGLTAFSSSPTGTPYNWCYASWHNGGLKVGVGLTTANGCFVWNGSTWVEHITTAPGTDFATPCVIAQTLIMARGGGTTLYQPLTGGAGAGTALGVHGDVEGTPPTGCGLAVEHGSRLGLAGDPGDQHVLYLSHDALAFYDFDYAKTDDGAAVALTFKDPITALLSHTRDCLLVGMTDSLSVVRGNSGSMQVETLSSEVGPLMQSAWCHDATGMLWMLTRDGVYTMPPGCGDSVTSVSREKLPNELLAIDPGVGDKVSVCYDHRWRGIHIYVDYNSGTDVHYFFDLQSGGFWPMSFANTLRLAVPIRASMTTSKSGLVALDVNSNAYQFDRDSSEPVDSFFVYGPLKLSDQGFYGILVDITARLASGSGSVAYEIYSGHSPEEAYAKLVAGTPIAFSGTWSIGGLSYHDHPRVGDECFYLKLKDVSNADWSHEGVDYMIQGRGFARAG